MSEPSDGSAVAGHEIDSAPVSRESLFGQGVNLTSVHPHGSNIFKKARDAQKAKSVAQWDLISGIAASYAQWRYASEMLLCEDLEEPEEYVRQQVHLFDAYRNVLDEPKVDAFDSRGALQSSALEEFCYYLLRPIYVSIEDRLTLGHRDVFQGLYFTAPSFSSFSELPTPHYPTGNLDFVVGIEIESTMETESTKHVARIIVPAVAIECKTYLDRPRWIESDILATSIKRGFPECLYIVLAEFLKLDVKKVNVVGSAVDKIYVIRRARNTDRSARRAGEEILKPLHAPALLDLFTRVRDHLGRDWASPEGWESSGILK